MKKNFFYIFKTYLSVFKYFSLKQKIKIILCFFFSLLTSILEILSLSSIIPFIMFLQNPNLILGSIYYKKYFSLLNLDINVLVFYFFIILLFLIILALVVKIAFLKLNCQVSYNIMASISNMMFEKIIFNNPLNYKALNTKDLTTTVVLRSQSIGECNYFIISIISSLTIILFIVLNSFLFAGLKLFIMFALVVFFYLIWWIIIKEKIKKFGSIFSNNYEKLMRNTNDVMSMFSEIKLYKIQNFFIEEFSKNNNELRKSQGNSTFVSSYPSVVIQSLLMMIFIIVLFFWNKYGNLVNQIPLFVFLVLTLQRLIPNFSTILTNYSNLTYQYDNLKKSIDLLDCENDKILKIDKNLEPKTNNFKLLSISNLSYINQQNNEKLFEKINIEIKRGDKISIKGPSGSGKTTFLNLLMGFINSGFEGKILINNKEMLDIVEFWHSKVSYVPQKIFILDDDIYTNIALKKNINIDEKKQIDLLLEKLNLKKTTSDNFELKNLGEDGKRLSGGQIQRLAIARCLFQKREVLILDETLNALDEDSAIKILEILKELKNLTIILIAHSDIIASQMNRVLLLDNKKLYDTK